MVVPSNYHLDPSTRKYSAVIVLGGETHWGDEWQDNLAEAESDLRCMINNLDYAATKTMQCEGFYPERAIIIEEKYITLVITTLGLYRHIQLEALGQLLTAQPPISVLILALRSLEIAFIILLIWAISLLYFARSQ
jgi:hypothetical protein